MPIDDTDLCVVGGENALKSARNAMILNDYVCNSNYGSSLALSIKAMYLDKKIKLYNCEFKNYRHWHTQSYRKLEHQPTWKCVDKRA